MARGGSEGLGRYSPLAWQSSRAHVCSERARAAYCEVRHAAQDQTDELWRLTGEEMAARISDNPLWLNTHGGGVAWLHIRIDNRPKYYGYKPYKNEFG